MKYINHPKKFNCKEKFVGLKSFWNLNLMRFSLIVNFCIILKCMHLLHLNKLLIVSDFVFKHAFLCKVFTFLKEIIISIDLIKSLRHRFNCLIGAFSGLSFSLFRLYIEIYELRFKFGKLQNKKLIWAPL